MNLFLFNLKILLQFVFLCSVPSRPPLLQVTIPLPPNLSPPARVVIDTLRNLITKWFSLRVVGESVPCLRCIGRNISQSGDIFANLHLFPLKALTKHVIEGTKTVTCPSHEEITLDDLIPGNTVEALPLMVIDITMVDIISSRADYGDVKEGKELGKGKYM
jgi:hypothetical protein